MPDNYADSTRRTAGLNINRLKKGISAKELEKAIKEGRGDEPQYQEATELALQALAQVVVNLTELYEPPEIELALQMLQQNRPKWFDENKALRPLSALFAPSTEVARVGNKISVARAGPNLVARQPAYIRVPTALPLHDTLHALFGSEWEENRDGSELFAVSNDTTIGLQLNEFGSAEAIEQVARFGPSTVQTLLALANLWHERNRGKPHETYTTASVSDLLRFQGRVTRNGGYDSADTIAKGREVTALSRIWIRDGKVTEWPDDKKTTRRVRCSPLLIVQTVEVTETVEEGSISSATSFRYHLGPDVYAWLCGKSPQYGSVSGKLLAYHPERDKYAILLGLALVFYSRVNERTGNRKADLKISLSALLNLAALPVPKYNVSAFLNSAKAALAQLSKDGVVPGVRLHVPDLAKVTARQAIEQATVTFPRLLPPPEQPDAPS